MKCFRSIIGTSLLTLLALFVLSAPMAHATSINYEEETNTAFMTIDEPYGGTANLALRFGGDLGEFLKFNRTTDRFVFSNDLYVIGNIDAFGTLSGSALVARNLQGSQSAASGSVLVSRTGNAPEWKTPTTTLVWYIDGALSTGTDQSAAVTMPFGFTVTDIDLDAKTAPAGAALIVDINENGTTIYSTNPQINDSATTEAGTEVLSDTTLAAGSRITVDIDQIGSTTGGSSLTIMLHGVRRY